MAICCESLDEVAGCTGWAASTWGGLIETIFNPVAVVEAAADKGAKVILMPISTRRQLVDLPDEVANRVVISHYNDAKDALIKALG